MSESAGVQEYLESIYRLSAGRQDRAVTTSQIALEMSVSPASASEMLKRLGTMGLVDHQPYAGSRLTQKGASEAARIVRYHRLWERFLVDVLGMPWDTVHDEACRLEHATTPEVARRLSKLLNDPKTCPHGNPLPVVRPARRGAEHADGYAPGSAGEADGDPSIPQPTIKMTDAPVGFIGTVASVLEDKELLRYCLAQGIVPGARFAVVASHPLEPMVEIEISYVPLSPAAQSAGISGQKTRRLTIGPKVGGSVLVSTGDGPVGGLH